MAEPLNTDDLLRQVIDRGWSVIPVNANKKALSTWAEFQKVRPTLDQIERWRKKQPAGWAVIGGEISNMVILDFDPPSGPETMRAFGLEPHVRTPSGGFHVWVTYPGVPVKTVNGKAKKTLGQAYPGLDIRATGGYAVFTGTTRGGTYELLRDLEPYPFEELPEDLQHLLLTGEPQATDTVHAPPTPPASADEESARNDLTRDDDFAVALIKRALDMTATDGRNNVGFWLACQLRDDGFPRGEATMIMRVFAQQVPFTNLKGEVEAYTEAEALKSLEQAYAAPTRPPWSGRSAGNFPKVIVNDRQLRDLVDDVGAALEDWNKPPRLYRRATSLVHLLVGDDGRLTIHLVSADALMGYASQSADFFKKPPRAADDDSKLKPARPPKDAVRALLDSSQLLGFPILRGVVEVPLMRPDGSILDEPGYDEKSEYLYEPMPGLVVPDIPHEPTRADVDAARKLLFDELLVDFPLVDDASQANAVGLLLTAVIRRSIAGQVPMALINAPVKGTGKSLLAEIVAVIATGVGAAMTTLSNNPEEERKRLTAQLWAGMDICVIDNIDTKLASGVLAAMLTAPVWSDRILGKSKMVVLRNTTVWMATGNNLEIGGDLSRRCYEVRMDAKVARPFQREFRHPNLFAWTSEHRGELIAALLTIARAWHAAGCPPGRQRRLGSFQSWADVIGGILDFVGIDGFLDNLDALYQRDDADVAAHELFLNAWELEFGSDPITSATVEAAIAGGCPEIKAALPDQLAEALDQPGGEATRKRRIGQYLAKLEGRRFTDDGLRLEHGPYDTHRKIQTWRVCRG